MKLNTVTVSEDVIEKSLKVLRFIPKAIAIFSLVPLLVFSFVILSNIDPDFKLIMPPLFIIGTLFEFYIIKKTINKKKLFKSISLSNNRIELSFYTDVISSNPMLDRISCHKNDLSYVISANNSIILTINLDVDIMQIMVPIEVRDQVKDILDI